jgi:hypothetical protein
LCFGKVTGFSERHDVLLQGGVPPNQLLFYRAGSTRLMEKTWAGASDLLKTLYFGTIAVCFRELFHWLRSEAARSSLKRRPNRRALTTRARWLAFVRCERGRTRGLGRPGLVPPPLFKPQNGNRYGSVWVLMLE